MYAWIYFNLLAHHHHYAIMRCDKDGFYHLTIALHLSLCCESGVHESVVMFLSFSEDGLSLINQKTVDSR